MHVIPRHAPVQLVIVFLDDLLDADDIVAVCEDGKICRFYFTKFKERSRFKSLSPWARPLFGTKPKDKI